MTHDFLTVIPSHESTFTISVAFPCGAIHDPLDKAGISHVLEHILFKDLLSNTQFLGWNAYTTRDYTFYYIVCKPLEYKNATRTIISKLFHRPQFREADIKREIRVILQEKAFHKSTSSCGVSAHVLKDTSYDVNLLGTVTSLGNIRAKDIQQHFQHMYKEFVVIALCPQELIPKVTPWLYKMFLVHLPKMSTTTSIAALPNPIPAKDIVELEQHKTIKQTVCSMVFYLPGYTVHAAHCARIAAALLKSKATELMRLHAPLIYSLQVDYHMFKHMGYFHVTFASIDPFQNVFDALIRVFETLCKSPIPVPEFQQHKRFALHSVSQSTDISQLRLVMMQKLHSPRVNLDTWSDYVKHIRSLKPKDVQAYLQLVVKQPCRMDVTCANRLTKQGVFSNISTLRSRCATKN